ncbi:MAG: serine hydrolase domain-containing protein [Anaerolineales bacterium]
MSQQPLKLSSIIFLFFLSLSAGVTPALAAPASGGPSDPVELGDFLDGVFAARMNADHVSGAVVAVVKEGRVLYTRGYGYSNLEKHTPVDPQKTLFRPGSVSKLILWTAVMQLAEQGKLSLEADVNTYLDFKIPATYPEPITLKTLMTHTPGFEDASMGLFKLKADEMTPLDVTLKTHLPARVFPPGTVEAYSNYGAALAGYIVERISGLPFSEYVEKNIFQPLEMTHSTFVQPLPANLAPDMARGYNYSNGAYVEGGFEFIPLYPAGALSATAADMSKFMIAHLQNGRYGDARILSEATAREMHSPLFAQDPRLHGMAYGFFENEINGQQVILHEGATLQFHSILILLPGANLGIFISTNATGGAATPGAVFKAFMDRYYPVQPQPAPNPPADFASRAAQYAGEYYISRSNVTGIEKIMMMLNTIVVSADREGHVFIGGSQGPVRYTEVEPGLLVADADPSDRVVLKVGPSGRISLLTSRPWELIKLPWYATLEFHALVFAGGLLLFIGALIGWLISLLSDLIRRRPRPLGARFARIAAALFMLVFIVFLAGLAGNLADVDPAFGVPRLFFGMTSGLNFILSLTPVMAGLGLLVLPFVFFSWKRSYWAVGSRLFYAFLAVWFWAVLWALHYWNLLL